MRIIEIVMTVMLIAILAVSIASFNMPSLLGRPLTPQLMQPAAPAMTSMALTPEDVKAQTIDSSFTLTISGNIYVDKLPVQGAEVTIYLNGKQMGRTTAGDIYQFSVPGVRIGDKVRVDAKYKGYTGTATETVKFKSIYLDVNIKSGRSFIRNALEMLPKKDDLSQQQQQQTTTQTTPTTQSSNPVQTAQSASNPSQALSTTDANQLTSQVVGDTTKTLINTIGQTKGGLAQPATASTIDAGSGININSLSDMMNAADTLAPTLS